MKALVIAYSHAGSGRILSHARHVWPTLPRPMLCSPGASIYAFVPGSVRFWGDDMSASKYDAPPLRSLADFKGTGYDKGRPYIVQAAWFAMQNLVFSKWWLPQALRPILLRLFGAEVGNNVFIRHRVRVLWPWKLMIGDNCWIGEDAWILNLEPVHIGHDVCVSQGAFLCTGSHDMASPTFEYDNAPIMIGDGVWLGAQAMVLRGVTIGSGSVIAARACIRSNVSAGSVLRSMVKG
jgi:putative colanic acid biosynthesis acetyltransferase WcaF